MQCFFCKGDMKSATTVHTTETDNRIIIIKNVPCMKCSQCGEVVYSGETINRIEQIVNSVKTACTEVAIVNYTDRVA